MDKLTLSDITSAISSGSIDLDILSSTLEKLKQYSYKHLYEIQESSLHLKKFR